MPQMFVSLICLRYEVSRNWTHFLQNVCSLEIDSEMFQLHVVLASGRGAAVSLSQQKTGCFYYGRWFYPKLSPPKKTTRKRHPKNRKKNRLAVGIWNGLSWGAGTPENERLEPKFFGGFQVPESPFSQGVPHSWVPCWVWQEPELDCNRWCGPVVPSTSLRAA